MLRFEPVELSAPQRQSRASGLEASRPFWSEQRPPTFPDKPGDCIYVLVDVAIRSGPEHLPVHLIKTVLKCGVCLVCPELN